MRGFTEFRGVTARVVWDEAQGAFISTSFPHPFLTFVEAEREVAPVFVQAADEIPAAPTVRYPKRRRPGRRSVGLPRHLTIV